MLSKYLCILPQCVYEDRARAGGVTSMRMSGNRVMVARLSGIVDMLLLEAATTVMSSGTPTTAPTASPLHYQHSDSVSANQLRQPLRPGECVSLSGSLPCSLSSSLMDSVGSGLMLHSLPSC